MVSLEHLCGATIRENSAFVEQDEALGKSRGQVEVVHDADNEDILPLRKGPQSFHEINLVTNIEEGQRLIQKQVTV